MFDKQTLDLILKGKKTQTRRLRKNEIQPANPGNIHKLKIDRTDKSYGYIEILSCDKAVFGDITETDARKEGFKNIEEYTEYFVSVNGEVKKNTPIWVINFKLVNVKTKYLFKVITDYVLKHPITEKPRNIGRTGKWAYVKDENGEVIGSTLTYKDGTTITYDSKNNITGIISDKGENLKYPGDRLYLDNYFYQHDVENLKYDLGNSDYMKLRNFAVIYTQNHFINNYLRGLCSKEEAIESMGEKNFNYIMNNIDDITEMLQRNDLKGSSFMSIRGVRHLHDNDGIGKRIVSDKAFTSASVGMNSEGMKSIYVGEDGWTIITEYDTGKANRGMFLGYAIRDVNGGDFEKELLSAPNQKFERSIIDEERRIIVQRPYLTEKEWEEVGGPEMDLSDLFGGIYGY